MPKRETETVEYLTELLNERDQKIYKLQGRVEELENTIDGDVWGWTIHGKLTDEENMGLPVPRLEMRWVALDDSEYNWAALYRLVYRHFLDDICVIPFGCTRRGGRMEPMTWERLDLPFRDGAHMRSDAKQLNLPAFVIYQDRVRRVDVSE